MKKFVLILGGVFSLGLFGCNAGGGGGGGGTVQTAYTTVGQAMPGYIFSFSYPVYEAKSNKVWAIGGEKGSYKLCSISVNASSNTPWDCEGSDKLGFTLAGYLLTTDNNGKLFMFNKLNNTTYIISYNTQDKQFTQSVNAINEFAFLGKLNYYNGKLYAVYSNSQLVEYTPSTGQSVVVNSNLANSPDDSSSTISTSGMMYGINSKNPAQAIYQSVTNANQNGNFAPALDTMGMMFLDLATSNNVVYACVSGSVYSISTSANVNSKWNNLGPVVIASESGVTYSYGCQTLTPDSNGYLYMFAGISAGIKGQLYKRAV